MFLDNGTADTLSAKKHPETRMATGFAGFVFLATHVPTFISGENPTGC